jgi:predicted amidohydrolase YtcJ
LISFCLSYETINKIGRLTKMAKVGQFGRPVPSKLSNSCFLRSCEQNYLLEVCDMQKADLILKNASVFTLNARQPHAKALAVRGNEIVAVGTDEEVGVTAGPNTRLIDLGGKLVLPGFNDCHTHFVGAALRAATTFDLYGVATITEVQNRLAEFAAQHPQDEWLYGRRWFPSRINDGAWPTRADLDVVESRPVVITDIDGHSCWANSAALQRVGYSANSPDPLGGKLLRGEDGFPSGVCFETAQEVFERHPPVSVQAFAPLFQREVARLNRIGVTSLSNNGIEAGHFEVLFDLAQAGKLDLRLSEWPALTADLSHACRLRERLRGSEILRCSTVKIFIDGVMSNLSAWMLQPYADHPETCGYPVMDPAEMEALVIEADRQGFQVATHAIGTRAVRSTLDMYEKARQVNGKRDARHRIEHIETSTSIDRLRFASLGVLASMTPVHCTADLEGYIISRLGEHGDLGFAWQSFLDAGAHLAFGTDWPAADMKEPNPLEQIFAAVTRQTPEAHRSGKPVWHPEQRITVQQAIRSYTLEGAYGEFMEERKGSLEPGKLADITVLSHNILECPPQEMLETEVVMTVFDGRLVYP